MKDIYLDWAATAPLDSDIMRIALELSLRAYGNPSSKHWLGKEARQALEESRLRILHSIGITKGNFIFTSSGTEADHIPIFAILERLRRASSTEKSVHAIISSIEHSAIEEQIRVLERLGLQVSRIDPDSRGHLEAEQVASKIRKETVLICIMNVNNETGAIQDIKAIAESIKEAVLVKKMKKPWLHVDAVQALGRLSIRDLEYYVDSFAISAHKIRGPKGIGGLWIARPLEAFIRGGGQESGLKPGTENLFGAFAFSLAAEKAALSMQTNQEKALMLEERLLDGISSIPNALIIPERIPKDKGFVPSIISIAFPGLGGETMVRALSDCHIAVSTGSACMSNIHYAERRVLKAMQVPEDIAFSSIRVSTGPLTTLQDIDSFLEQVEVLYRRLKT
ncbi:MAG: Cysteine desulfurase [Spirochaetes bacterium ADurb.Bin110]|nr:MAG: Cysteine desulfurase [Spirochaetes bacterium ADurb.Bin110]